MSLICSCLGSEQQSTETRARWQRSAVARGDGEQALEADVAAVGRAGEFTSAGSGAAVSEPRFRRRARAGGRRRHQTWDRDGGQALIPEFIYFSWFIQTLNIIQMEIFVFPDQRQAGRLPAGAVSSVSSDETAVTLWVLFAFSLLFVVRFKCLTASAGAEGWLGQTSSLSLAPVGVVLVRVHRPPPETCSHLLPGIPCISLS